ncbi:MAG: hypothetical protein ABIF85_00855 [Nanoarchaeota archaeon]|nr:hypothetical protein [Nanoarchaeota archaeon]MBU4300477.1 hypothetical protein [Nanoarchaeota archaeon]MBU4451957.1 hypothetical protein [Nanoarchaeota archaeon]MCG2724116.1 hypothetical protein [archaeon]
MVDLFVYDGSPIVRDMHLKSNQKDEELQNVFREVIRSLKPNIPQDLLLRTVVDYNRDNFGGVNRLLLNCMSNGHDRISDSNWGSINDEAKKELIIKGYSSKDVIYAKPEIRDGDPKPYNWSGASHGVNVGLLIIDKGAYNEEFYTIYAQNNVNVRKKGLRGILLFDMDKEQTEPRANLHVPYVSLEYVGEAMDKIHRAGYFTK